MDKAKSVFSVICPEHAGQLLVRVNPDSYASKQVYCIECLMHSEDPKTLYASLPKIEDFLTNAAATFADYKSRANLPSEVPKEYLDVVARQAESLETLSKHIIQEKKNVETLFDEILKVIVDMVNKIKSEYIELLDRQVTNLHENYVGFEKMIRMFYPKKEDIDIIFPVKEELEKRLTEIKDSQELDTFIMDIKQRLLTSKSEIRNENQNEAIRRSFIDLDESLRGLEGKKPVLEKQNDLDLQAIKEQVEGYLSQLLGLGNAFSLKDAIAVDMDTPGFIQQQPQSDIVNFEDFQLLKKWIPANVAFNPRLLYRMTRDGKIRQVFHSMCDKKGPTITLIKCKYQGASDSCVIGAFSDLDFDEHGKGFVTSDQAFVFSLTSKIKCDIVRNDCAMWNGSGLDIWFGSSGTIGIKKDFSLCTSCITSPYISYEDSFKIIPSESYKGPNIEHRFELEEIEVYAIN